MEHIYKNCVFILTCLNFSHLHSPFDAIHLLIMFPHCTKQFLNLLILMPFCASAVFVCCFTSSALPKHLPLRTFSYGETKKVTQGNIRWIGRVGHRVQAIFGQKLLNTQHGVGSCTHKSPIMKWANMLNVLKKIKEAKRSLSQSYQLVH